MIDISGISSINSEGLDVVSLKAFVGYNRKTYKNCKLAEVMINDGFKRRYNIFKEGN